MSRILIIEDDKDLQDGLKIFHEQGCDMILLDCNLPDGNGFDLCSAIKREQDIPILMLTARDTEMDEVKALELGMDDFMSKPFSLAVLKARIKKLLRNDVSKLRMLSGNIMIDKSSCKVYKNGTEINCSKTEYQMLEQVLNRERIEISDIREGEISALASRIIRIQEKLEYELNSAQEEKEQVKSLISNMSHQLKTPLSSAIMYRDLLETENGSEKRQYFLDRMKHCIIRNGLQRYL